ncbi:MAG: redoxin domain-containing protein [Myxococcota bacterium]
MSQLVELQEALPKFAAAGIKLYAVSYDEPAALAEFAKHHGITFPLLADRGSRVIRRYGILNTFVTREQVPFYGIPFPGTYLVDERGGSELQVWDGTVDIAIPVWPDSRLAPLVSEPERRSVRIDVTVHYQACDERTCRVPQRAHFELDVPIDPWDAHGLGGLRGQRFTTMDTARYMKRWTRPGT